MDYFCKHLTNMTFGRLSRFEKPRQKAAAVLMFVVLGMHGAAVAQQVQEPQASGAGALLENSNASPLLNELGPLAMAGDVRAQTQLGRALLLGDGIDQDIKAGIVLLEAAAAAGSAEAWFRLGNAYSDASFYDFDAMRALEAYRQAISLGSANAYVGLGKLLEAGAGSIPADSEAAIAAYEAAIASGVGARAQIALAQGHLRGRFGELSDPTVGEEIYRQLAIADDLTAQVQLGQALLDGDEVDQDIDAGIGLLEAAAEAGSADAWQRLGDVFSRGTHQEVDGARALEAYNVAVALGSPRAYLEIGRLLTGNAGVPADPQGAIDAYEAAISSGDAALKARAELALAQGHLTGLFGAMSDNTKSLKIYDRLADAGNTQAKLQLGVSLVQGDGIAQDADRGIALLEEAAAEGSVDAWFRLGDFYSAGQFVELNGARALEAYQQAVALGSEWAYLQIGRVLEGGAGLPADPQGAIAAYESAIANGNSDLATRAETRLAQGHLGGRFGPLSSPEEGLRISERLALAGDVGAQVRLGQALILGEEIERDIDGGITLLEAAAAEGSSDAWLRLGDAFSDGLVLEIDVPRAVNAYNQAIAIGDPRGYLRLGGILEGDEEAGIPADPQGALAAYESAAAAENQDLSARAKLAMAQGHLAGQFGELSDPFEGERIFQSLMAAGDSTAIVQLARVLLEGDGIEQNTERAISLLETAGAEGSAEAWSLLGDAYSNALYLEIDGARAVQAYEEAIALGSQRAKLQIARLLEGQLGVPADPERAMSYYEAAIESGQPDLRLRAEIGLAQGHLGNRFGSLSDQGEGLRIFDRLADSGDPVAQVQLGRLLVRDQGRNRDLPAGVGYLLSAADRSERAQRELVFGLIRASARERSSVRQQLLDHYESFAVAPPKYIQLLAAISTPRVNYANTWDLFTELPIVAQKNVLSAAANSDRKLYASLLQGTMVATGDLNGGIDGLFGPATLNAYLRFCPKVTERRLCQRGPFFNQTRAALVEYIPELLANADLRQ